MVLFSTQQDGQEAPRHNMGDNSDMRAEAKGRPRCSMVLANGRGRAKGADDNEGGGEGDELVGRVEMGKRRKKSF